MADNFNVIRQSIIEWYPVKIEDNVLLVNENEGFLEELLQGRCNLTSASSLKDIESGRFDLIVVYDFYDLCIREDKDIENVLSTLISLKEDKGSVLLAMENKLGMKYWAGCAEEQRGEFFVGIEDYYNWEGKVRPLSKKELEDILKGFDKVNYKFYYPYPDYKYPTMIFSDECLPKEGDLFRNIRNVDRERYVVLDERRAFDSIIKAGLFPEFSNSFLIELK